jgi:iron complex outermembrane receptor protein
MRVEFASDGPPMLLPRLAFVFGMPRHAGWQFIASAAANGLRPGLNDLYWQPGGNPDLLPERSWNGEGGVQWRERFGSFMVEGDLRSYISEARNWIQWLPGPDGVWTPANLTQVRSTGLDLGVGVGMRAGDWHGQFATQYAWVHARDRAGDAEGAFAPMLYLPAHKATFDMNLAWRDWRLGNTIRINGRRITASDGYTQLPAYAVWDVQAGRSIQIGDWHLDCALRLENLLNTYYESVQNRPMPPRSWRIEVLLGLGQRMNRGA